MTVFLVRHGEPNYEAVKDLGLVSYLADLTPKGFSQAKEAALKLKDSGAEIILTSPYTRALQTAYTIKEETNLPIIVEPRLHEWLEDTTHRNTLENGYFKSMYDEFLENKGKKNSNTIFPWEDINTVACRAHSVLEKYRQFGYKKIIVVAHAIVIRTLGYTEQTFPYGTIFEKEFDENTKYTGFIPWYGC